MTGIDFYKSGYTSPFGDPRPGGRKHRGQDLSHSRTPGTIGVPAAHAGVVVGKTAPSSTHGFGYGITIQSRLADGNLYNISYSHGPWASQQQIGQQVAQGQIILHEGNSGATEGSCVHIEQQRVGGGFLDPAPELRRVGLGIAGGGTPAGGGGTAPASAVGATTKLKGKPWVTAIQTKYRALGHDLGPAGIDGKDGPRFVEITVWEQGRAGAAGNPGGALIVDGVAGDKTNAYLDWQLAKNNPQPPTPSAPIVNIANIAVIGDVRGLQKIAAKNGYKGKIDNQWGGGSQAGLQNFLNAAYGGSISNWLRKRWGYVGDDRLGPVMIAALRRANAANA